MKMAVVWDFLIDRGGAEREILILSKALNADLITTQYLPTKTYSGFSNIKVISNPLKNFKKPILMQREASKTFRKIDLSDYDIIISIGDWAKQVALNKTLKGRHIHITISPPRMFSDLKSNIERRLSFFKRCFFRVWVHFGSIIDKRAMSNIKEIIVQSAEAKKRIESYYNRRIYKPIIYPPTEIDKFRCGKSHGYFLSVQRIMPEKGIEIQIKAFNQLPDEKLIIVGSVLDSKLGYLDQLKKTANKNIKFFININDKKLIGMYSHSRCVIQTSTKEDFGLVPIESMASGKPVIAVNEGGFKETVIEGKTGVLINKPYIENLIKTIKGFDEYSFKKNDIRKRALEFSDKVFIKKINHVIFQKV